MKFAGLFVVLLLLFIASVPVWNSAVGAAVTTAAQDPSAVEASMGLDRPARRLIQQGLRTEGFDPGAPDGLFGPRTRTAIREWQEARGVPPTGYLDSVDVDLLRAAAARVAPDDLRHRDVLKILVFGDAGTGYTGQYRVAEAMAHVCRRVKCDFALTLGDNIYENGIEIKERNDSVASYHEVLAQFDRKFERQSVVLGQWLPRWPRFLQPSASAVSLGPGAGVRSTSSRFAFR